MNKDRESQAMKSAQDVQAMKSAQDVQAMLSLAQNCKALTPSFNALVLF